VKQHIVGEDQELHNVNNNCVLCSTGLPGTEEIWPTNFLKDEKYLPD
jgi:hypothetical protein